MDLRHFVSAGVAHYYLPAPVRLDWLTGVLRQLEGATVTEDWGLASFAVTVERGGERVVLYEDPKAGAVVLLHPAGQPQSALFAEVVRLLRAELAKL